MVEFKQGDECFDNRGRKVEFVSKCDTGYVVRPLMKYSKFNGYDDYETYVEPSGYDIVEGVFLKAPTEHYDYKIQKKIEEIKSLDQKILGLRNEVYAINSKKSDLKDVESEILSRLSRIKNLKNIEDYLDGKMEWYVETNSWGRVSYGPIKDLKSSGEDRSVDYKLKLIALKGEYNEKEKWGKPEGVSWVVCDYYDGSGGHSRNINLYKTEQECIEFCKEYLTGLIMDNKVNMHNRHNAANDLIAMGIDVPPSFVKQHEKFIEDARVKKEQYNLKEIEKLERKLAEAKEKVST